MNPPFPHLLPRSIEQMAEQACDEHKLERDLWKPILQDVMRFALACQRMRMGLSPEGRSIGEPIPPYDYVRARSKILEGIQAFLNEASLEGVHLKTEAVLPKPEFMAQPWTGESAETGDVLLTYSFALPSGHRTPEVTVLIDHDSNWSVGIDIVVAGHRKLMAVQKPWDWALLVDAVKRSLSQVHGELSTC